MLAQINHSLEKYNGNYSFDIVKIDNMDVFVKISNKHLYLEARNIERSFDGDNEVLYGERILAPNESVCNDGHLEKLIEMFNNLKFNKFRGKFYLNDDDHGNIKLNEIKEQEEFYKKLNSNVEVRKTYENCPICFEPTMCKSRCGHFCCYVCWNKLEDYYCDDCRDSDDICCDCDEIECGGKRCPICRKKLMTIN